uniref:nucleoside diphosphate phosphatase n=1 Tax=Oncorhynchus mykiss TaxID=8022 RepID=A0A8K9UQH6_ONCMY
MSVLAWNFQVKATYHPRQTVHHEHSANMENLLPENLLLEVVPKVLPEVLLEVSHPVNLSRTFYGIMFDAGSTGTRIHIYTFIQKDPVELPVLDNEMYHAVKPGLSAYKDKPEEGGNTIRALLKVAKKTVPEDEWKQTPVVLKATAGLRLLPKEKANALLDEVREVFDESPFFVPNNSVSIMNGTNEGVLAWVTVNFLTGHLYAKTRKTVGILDLGGGSTQITFLPKSKVNVQLNSTDKFREDWTFGGITYKVSGIPDGYAGYKLCYYEVMRVVKGIVHQPFEVKGSSIFYAFSYYFDRAVESGLIDGSRGGMVEVRDFKKRAKEVCNKMTKYRPISPFLCMDMTYITCLLKEGFGFKDNTMLQVRQEQVTGYCIGDLLLGCCLQSCSYPSMLKGGVQFATTQEASQAQRRETIVFSLSKSCI